MSRIIAIYTTFSTAEESKMIIKGLLELKLIACANVLQGESYYKWESNPVKDSEIFATLKTIKGHWSAIVNFVKLNHSYDIPSISYKEITCEETYASWIRENVI